MRPSHYETIPAPEMPDGVIYELRADQVLLSFSQDRDAGRFREWWDAQGFELFDQWATARIEGRKD